MEATQVRKFDRQASSPFVEVCSVHAARGWKLASRLTRCSADADDVMQDAFVVAWTKRKSIPENVWPWFCRVIVNCSRNHLRKTAKIRSMSPIDYESASDTKDYPEQVAHANELRMSLLAAMKDLSKEEHAAVGLCVLGGLSQAEASEVTGVKLNTIKSRVRRGLERLKEKLKNGPHSLEAFMALPALPFASGEGLDSSVSRWVTSAKGATLKPWMDHSILTSIMFVLAAAAVVTTSIAVGTDVLIERVRQEPNSVVAADTPAPTAEEPRRKPADSSTIDGTSSSLPFTQQSQDVDVRPTNVSAQGAPATRENDLGAQAQLTQVLRRYPSGEVRVEGTALRTDEGLVSHGHFVSYRQTGEKYDEGDFVRGVQVGTWTTYHPNQTVASKGEYVDGLMHGLWIYHRNDGSVETIGNYFRGAKSGTWTTYYTDGDVKRIDQFVGGKLAGLRKEYDSEGGLTLTTEYTDGHKNGLQIEYEQSTGRVVRESRFENGEKHGLEQLFDPATEQIVEIRFYERDVLISED